MGTRQELFRTQIELPFLRFLLLIRTAYLPFSRFGIWLLRSSPSRPPKHLGGFA